MYVIHSMKNVTPNSLNHRLLCCLTHIPDTIFLRNLIEHFFHEQVDVVTKAINTLVRGDNYQLRQLWVELSLALLEELPQILFEKFFLDGLLYLTSDAVLNVRVAVGVVLTGWPGDRTPFTDGIDSPWTWLLTRPDIRECVNRLSVDDHDVYIAMINLQV